MPDPDTLNRNAGAEIESRKDSHRQHLLEAAPDAILEVDQGGQVVWMNSATERLFGYTRDELTGRNVDVLVPTEIRARHSHHRANYATHALTRPMGSGLLLQGQRRDGSRFPVEISLSPFEGGGELRIAAVIRDVTDRVKADEEIRALHSQYAADLTIANRQLEQRNREVEAANHLKTEFLASMSHELRTPLHTIIGFAELLEEQQEGELTDKQRRFVNHILRDGRHLLELINDILDLSKIEAGRLDLRYETFEWTDTAAEVTAGIQLQAHARQVVLQRSRLPAGILYADRVRFKAVLFNLLSNAVKFTPPGGSVWLEAEVSNQSLSLTVCDTGIGIEPDQQTRIFDKFYQTGMTAKGVREGTGLGLAITKSLVEAHGGSIRLESTPGRGSRFTVEFPLTQDIKTPIPSPQDNRRQPLVLVADPDPQSREQLIGRLRKAGYRIEVATSGAEAVEMARRLQPDGITLDFLTLASDGWAALRALRLSPLTAPIPVLLASNEQTVPELVRSGASDCLIKPVDREILLNSLGRHVKRNPGAPSKILLVDDDPVSMEWLEEVLGNAGYVPILKSTGREALETLAKTSVSAAILDLMMPGMSGFELIIRIREQPAFQDLPLLLLTAQEISPEDWSALSRQTKGVLLKNGEWGEDLASRFRALGRSEETGSQS